MLGEMGTELSLANLKRMPALLLLISQVPAAPPRPALPLPPHVPTGQGTAEQLNSLSVHTLAPGRGKASSSARAGSFLRFGFAEPISTR